MTPWELKARNAHVWPFSLRVCRHFLSDLDIATATSNWVFISRSHYGLIIYFFISLLFSLLSFVFVVKLHAEYEPLVGHSPHGPLENTRLCFNLFETTDVHTHYCGLVHDPHVGG